MRVDKYLKYANSHYPYYSWGFVLHEQYKELEIEVRHDWERYRGLVYFSDDYLYHDKDVRNMIKKLAKEMKKHLRMKKTK